MRRWAWPLPSPEGTSRRNFIASILGMEKDAEESDGVEEYPSGKVILSPSGIPRMLVSA
jgi:hypothetical protein